MTGKYDLRSHAISGWVSRSSETNRIEYHLSESSFRRRDRRFRCVSDAVDAGDRYGNR